MTDESEEIGRFERFHWEKIRRTGSGDYPGHFLHGIENPLLSTAGERYKEGSVHVQNIMGITDEGGFRVRDIRGRNVMINELHDVYVQSILWR